MALFLVTQVGGCRSPSADLQSFDRCCTTSLCINIDEGTTQQRSSVGGLETCRNAIDEALDSDLLSSANDRFLHSRHTCIRQIGRALGEQSLIGGLDMSVSPNHGTDLAVQMVTEGNLLGRRFGVEVDDDARRLLPQFVNPLGADAKGAIDGGHEGPALKIQDTHPCAVPGLHDDGAISWGLYRIVEGAKDSLCAVEASSKIGTIPDVIPRCDHIDAVGAQLAHDVLGHPKTARGVFTVGDTQVDVTVLNQLRDDLRSCATPGASVNVGDKKKTQSDQRA